MNIRKLLNRRSGILAAATILATAAAIAIEVRPGATDRAPSRLRGRTLQREPAWHLKDTAGADIRSTEGSGKVKLIAFWATWCPPCRAEIPGFIELQRDFKDRGLQILAVSMDDDSPAKIASFAAKFGMNYPVLLGTPEVTKAFGGIDVLPTTFLVDRNGRIARSHHGYVPPEVLRKEVQELLGP